MSRRVDRSKYDLERLRAIFVGDSMVGRKCLLTNYSHSTGTRVYRPSNWIVYGMQVEVEGQLVELMKLDIYGTEFKFKNIRVILICFSIVAPETFEAVKTTWYPEVSHHCPNTPIILVGNKQDLRDDADTVQELRDKQQAPISYAQGLTMMKEVRAVKYLECSALSGEGVAELLDEAIIVALMPIQLRKRQNVCNLI